MTMEGLGAGAIGDDTAAIGWRKGMRMLLMESVDKGEKWKGKEWKMTLRRDLNAGLQ